MLIEGHDEEGKKGIQVTWGVDLDFSWRHFLFMSKSKKADSNENENEVLAIGANRVVNTVGHCVGNGRQVRFAIMGHCNARENDADDS